MGTDGKVRGRYGGGMGTDGSGMGTDGMVRQVPPLLGQTQVPL
jgi:hypothetical protein